MAEKQKEEERLEEQKRILEMEEKNRQLVIQAAYKIEAEGKEDDKKGKRKKAKDQKNEFLDDTEYPHDVLMGDNPYNMDQEKDDLIQTSSNDGDFEPGNSNEEPSQSLGDLDRDNASRDEGSQDGSQIVEKKLKKAKKDKKDKKAKKDKKLKKLKTKKPKPEEEQIDEQDLPPLASTPPARDDGDDVVGKKRRHKRNIVDDEEEEPPAKKQKTE